MARDVFVWVLAATAIFPAVVAIEPVFAIIAGFNVGLVVAESADDFTVRAAIKITG